jgi:hypothetical protein
MEILIKIPPQAYDRLRRHISTDSPAFEAVDKASRIDHSIEGVLFAGYAIACNEVQARILLDIAKQHCSEIIPDIEKAITLARSR